MNEVVFIYSDNEYDNDSDTITNIVSSKNKKIKKRNTLHLMSIETLPNV